MVKFSSLVNPLILDAGWVRFQGNSEFKGDDGEYKMGYWSFLGIIAEDEVEELSKEYATFSLDDEIDENEIIEQELAFLLWNTKGELCAVQFHYRSDLDE